MVRDGYDHRIVGMRGIIQFEHNVADEGVQWRWIVQVGGTRPPGCVFDGRAGSLEKAKAAFRENLQKWMEAAEMIEKPSSDA